MSRKDVLGSAFENYLNVELSRLIEMEPKGLYEPICYALECGGKRLRPMLTLIAAEAYGGECADSLSSSFALEMFHNFTLLHDDIMDEADLRRGRDSVHKRYGQNSAILSGDAMQILAYSYLNYGSPEMIVQRQQLFNKTALEVCCGQQYDTDFESRLDVTLEEYFEMIRLKTAVLLACSLKMGAIDSGASEDECSKIYNLGVELGLAFQLQDDLLDSYGDVEIFGKKIGGDILLNKKTALMILAKDRLEGAAANEFNELVASTSYSEEEKISSVLRLYGSVGVKESVEAMIDSHYSRAVSIIESLSIESGDMLYEIANVVKHRTY